MEDQCRADHEDRNPKEELGNRDTSALCGHKHPKHQNGEENDAEAEGARGPVHRRRIAARYPDLP
jgi:hypothetical protein